MGRFEHRQPIALIFSLRGPEGRKIVIETKRNRFFGVKTEKRCYACKRTLLLEEFPLDRAKFDGRKSVCRPCHRLRERSRYAEKVAA